MRDAQDQVKFFRRTSTHVVLDSIYSGHMTFNEIKDDLLQRGHKRKDHDIRQMVRALERVGLIEEGHPTEFGEKVRAFRDAVQKVNDSNLPNSATNDKVLQLVGLEILRGFYQNGFLLISFLKALQEPSNYQVIASRFFQAAEEDGFYNLNPQTDFNDFVPSMKNFAVYLGFARQVGRRHVVITEFTRRLLQMEGPRIVDRERCELEYCRKVCPAEAIYSDHIEGCVKCGLCARCCPYGNINCEQGQVQFQFHLCHQLYEQKETTTCRLSPSLYEIIGSERTMQRWIQNLLRICGLPAIIPGPGSKPDLLINRTTGATVVECKNEPIRGKKLENLEFQLETYMTQKNLDETCEYVKTNWQFMTKTPDVFFVCAPAASDVNHIISDLGPRLHYPLSFISAEAFLALHKVLLARRKIATTTLEPLFSEQNVDVSRKLIAVLSST